MTAEPIPDWVDDNHALHTGRLLGLLRQEGVEAIPVMSGGDYTPWLDITIPGDGIIPDRVLRIHVEGVVAT